MIIQRWEQMLYSFYNQFYVEDRDFSGDTGHESFWTESSTHDKLAVSEGTLGIGTGTYGEVRVYSELHDSPPTLDLSQWDHATEAGLTIKSGKLQVVGCPDREGDVYDVQPGTYRIRCLYADLDGAVDVGTGDDWYVVQFWPAPVGLPVILKRWSDATEQP